MASFHAPGARQPVPIPSDELPRLDPRLLPSGAKSYRSGLARTPSRRGRFLLLPHARMVQCSPLDLGLLKVRPPMATAFFRPLLWSRWTWEGSVATGPRQRNRPGRVVHELPANKKSREGGSSGTALRAPWTEPQRFVPEDPQIGWTCSCEMERARISIYQQRSHWLLLARRWRQRCLMFY